MIERDTESNRAHAAAFIAMSTARLQIEFHLDEAKAKGDMPQSAYSVAADVQYEIGRAAAWALTWLLLP